MKLLPENVSNNETTEVVQTQSTEVSLGRLGKRELAPIQNFKTTREEALLPAIIPQSDGLVPSPIQSLVKCEEDVKVIGFEVFKNYLVILQERNKKRELNTMNLLSQKAHIHQFDSQPERNPSDGKRSQFYNVSLQDNLTFDEVNLNYAL